MTAGAVSAEAVERLRVGVDDQGLEVRVQAFRPELLAVIGAEFSQATMQAEGYESALGSASLAGVLGTFAGGGSSTT
jgi:hypothetical protein